MAEGWISVYRQIKDSAIWNSNEPFDRRSAWIDLLLSANHETKNIQFDGKIITVERGSFITSMVQLAVAWRWERRRVSRFLRGLETDSMIAIKTDNKKTAITILNYDKYQQCIPGDGTAKRTAKCSTDGHQTHIKRTSDGHQMDTNNNENNDNNENKYIHCTATGYGFDEFWSLYPRKIGKKAALIAWKKIKPNAELYDKIMAAIRKARESPQWQKDNGQFIPHPTTWLNQGRWDDEYEAGAEKPKMRKRLDGANYTQHEYTREDTERFFDDI